MVHQRPEPAPATAPICAKRDHDGTERCPLHGCPGCLMETLEYDDSPLAPALLPEDQEHAQEVADGLHDLYVMDQGGTCLICAELVVRATWARYPGMECELEDCLHCLECDACMKATPICRWCERCPAHEVEDGSQCERERWSKALLRPVTYFAHSYRDPITGLWSR